MYWVIKTLNAVRTHPAIHLKSISLRAFAKRYNCDVGQIVSGLPLILKGLDVGSLSCADRLLLLSENTVFLY